MEVVSGALQVTEADPALLKGEILNELARCEGPIYRDALMRRCNLAKNYQQFCALFGELVESGEVVVAGGAPPRQTFTIGSAVREKPAAAPVGAPTPAPSTAAPPTAAAVPRKGASARGKVKQQLQELIAERERTSIELGECLGLTSSAVLYHLKQMKEAGTIAFHPAGSLYSLAEVTSAQMKPEPTPEEARHARRAHVALAGGEKTEAAEPDSTPAESGALKLILSRGKVQLIELKLHPDISTWLNDHAADAIERLLAPHGAEQGA